MPDEGLNKGDLSRQTVTGVSWQILASAIKFVAQFGIGIVLARLLPPEDFGIVGIAYIATGFATILIDLGLGPAIIQRRNVTERHIRVSHTLSVIAGVMIGLGLFYSSGYAADFFDDHRVEPVLKVLAVLLPLSSFGITANALLTKRMAFDTLVRIELLASILGYGGVSVTMAALGWGYWALVGGTIAQITISTFSKYGAEKHSIQPLIARGEIKDLFAFSAGMSLNSTLNYFARQGDYFVVGRLMDASSLGFYSRAYTLMQMPVTLFGQAISRVLFPAASRVQDEPDRVRRAFLTAMAVSISVSLLPSLGLAILAPEVVLVLYGEQWAETVPLLQILALFGVFRMGYNNAGVFVKAAGQAYRHLASQVLYGTLVVAGSYILGSAYGLEGVAWAVGGAIFSCWLLLVAMAYRAARVSLVEITRVVLISAMPGLTLILFWWAAVEGMRSLHLPPSLVLVLGALALSLLWFWALLCQVNQTKHPALLQGIDAIRSRIKSFRHVISNRTS